MLTILSLVPAILIMVTSFTRIVVVLSFVRNAISTNAIPPNQVVVALALFITLFVMAPTFRVLQAEVITPYMEGELTQDEALEGARGPISQFMLRYTRENDLALFINASGGERPDSPADVPLTVLIPAFMISELKTAFQMGIMLFVPFLVIDMVVASTLLSMGMFMLPPGTVSLPFKLLLFVLADGWHLVVKSILESF
jgi:flagellar biosynthetic protein FliP